MGLSKVDTSFAEILSGEVNTPRFGSSVIALVKCKLMYCQLLMEDITNSTMKVKDVKSVSESFEVCKESLGTCDEGHDKDRGYVSEVVSEGTYPDEHKDISAKNTQPKPLHCHLNTMEAAVFEEGLSGTPTTHGSDPSPWVMLEKTNEVSFLSLETIHVEKFKPLGETRDEENLLLFPNQEVVCTTPKKAETVGPYTTRKRVIEPEGLATNLGALNGDSSAVTCSNKPSLTLTTSPHPSIGVYEKGDHFGFIIHLVDGEGVSKDMARMNLKFLQGEEIGIELRDDTSQFLPFTILNFDPGGELM